MWWMVLLSLLFVSALNWALVFRWKHSFKEAVQLTATLVSIASTVVLGFFAWQSFQHSNRSEELEQRRQWTELRNTMWEIMEQYPPSGIELLRSLPSNQRAEWITQIRRLLNAQGTNQVLMTNEECLAHWRNATATAMIANSMQHVDTTSEIFTHQASSIMKDVMFVWEKLVLDSGEVSATGGLPNK